ncbi:TetR/AcrR family transcriptional regulator [Dyella sp. Tek66A03]|uniref:TetR/AcrR family transcriptional regulator n=1 Tax=Dyella sp. Tek66A03 TaxID=3458298 RepID=UPI00403E7786
MPTEKTPPDIRSRLVEATIRLLATHGPSEVKARSVSSEAGLSTMGVYSYFGGVPELLHAVAAEGFEREAAVFGQIAHTEDPMTDLCAMALACWDFARSNPHLYDLMFGLSIYGRYNPSRGEAAPDVRERSLAFEAVYAYLVRECARLVDTRCVRKIDPDLIAVQLWSALHGFIMLELSNYFGGAADPSSDILMPMCVNLVVGLGAKREKAEASAANAMAAWAGLQQVRPAAKRSRKPRKAGTK